MALAGGRYVLIPAAVAFIRMPDGAIRAELSAVLADVRSGRVDWRTLVKGLGATPEAALVAALEFMLPAADEQLMSYDVTLVPGDGIGPEITAATVRVLERTGLTFRWDEQIAGMAAVEAAGTPLPDATLESIRKTRLALKGPSDDAGRHRFPLGERRACGRNSNSSPMCGRRGP